MKKLAIISLALVLLLSFAACDKGETESGSIDTEITTEGAEMTTEKYGQTAQESFASDTEEKTETVDKGGISAVEPADKTKIVLANEDVYEWWSSFHWAKTDSDPYYRHEDIYYPDPVTLSWTYDGGEADYYRVYLSRNADMSDASGYLVNTDQLKLNDLFVGTTYYWQVDAVSGNNYCERSEVFTFTTADSPRCIKIEGVSNTRDIGGMEAADGYRIKQGMIYRGGKLEDITEEGKAVFVDILGLKTDLDLRTPGEGGAGTTSPLGEEVNYVNIDGRYYTGSKGISNDEGKALFAQEIRLFADPDNYPIYIHCSLGRDRTGTLAFVIEALLGVDKNTLMMDYELSVFSVTGTLDNASVSAIRNNIRATYDYLATFEGASFAEKTENYLLSIGITAEEIRTIRELLLEEVK